ncbi:MAG: hypothetical protein ACHP84_12150 [Caulobacterales bacterium]
MTFRVGSTPWLFAHEMRLAWRGAITRRGGRGRLLVVSGLLLAGMVFAGVPLGFAVRHANVPIIPVVVVVADAAVATVFTLMLSQTLAAATETLYSRGDLDLLFSSPIAPRKVLTVRIAAIAANVFAAFALLATPLLLPVAVIGHPAWLAAYLVLAALALTASALGLAIAMGLFRLIGPRRTRSVAQILAALIGAALFLTAQARNILGGRRTSLWADLAMRAARENLHLPPAAAWPLRAMLGSPAPLLVLLATGAAAFAASAFWIGRHFAADSAAASGASLSTPARSGAAAAFAGGPFAVTVRKELRLLVRDIALLAQVLLRLLYLLPLAFVVLRGASGQAAYSLPLGVAGLTFLSGQVAASLTWITMSAEDAPELIACAPAPISTVRRAKLTAALAPLAVILAVPLAILLVMSPIAGVAALLGCAGSALASGLINTWLQKPGKRSEFRRRRASSWTAGIAVAVIGALISGAAALAVVPSIFALAPLALAVVALMLLRRSDSQINEAIAAG